MLKKKQKKLEKAAGTPVRIISGMSGLGVTDLLREMAAEIKIFHETAA